jgi:hypothetical protein
MFPGTYAHAVKQVLPRLTSIWPDDAVLSNTFAVRPSQLFIECNFCGLTRSSPFAATVTLTKRPTIILSAYSVFFISKNSRDLVLSFLTVSASSLLLSLSNAYHTSSALRLRQTLSSLGRSYHIVNTMNSSPEHQEPAAARDEPSPQVRPILF